MQVQFAPTTPPPPPYGSPEIAIRFDAGGDLHRIVDPSGQDRRVWEGWASLEGIDWEDEDYPAAVFENAMRLYTAKNPVVLWDHIRDMPIGQITEWQVVPQRGVFVRGYVFDQRDFPYGGNILAKCNEVWPIVQSGHIRGLSWVGVARKRWVYSEDLGKPIKQATEILIHEITITPTQVNPGAKITGVSVAKAIQTCKALTIGDTQMSIEKVKKAQAQYLAALHELQDGQELPSDLVTNQQQINAAMGLKPQEQTVEDASKSLKNLEEQIAKQQAELEVLKGKAAPLRNQVSHQPGSSSSPKPSEGGHDFMDVVSKALEMGGSIRDGKLNGGTGEAVQPVPGPDLMGMYMVRKGLALNWPDQAHRPQISFSPAAQALMARAEQQ